MKYNVTIYAVADESIIEDTDFSADTDHEATEYALVQAQFKGYEEYLLKLRSDDKSFHLMCTGNRGTHIKA
jgi:hypothetical protein